MPRITVQTQQAIIDQQAEQLSRLATKLSAMQRSAVDERLIRRAAMNAAKAEAKKLGKVVVATRH